MGRKKKAFVIPEDDICYEEDIDEIEFTDYIPPNKNTLALFTFDTNNEEEKAFDKRNEPEAQKETKTEIKETPKPKKHSHVTYPINSIPENSGEAYDTSRTYLLRKSTVQKINVIRANCYECHLYVSAIVDDAINFYFDYLQNK